MYGLCETLAKESGLPGTFKGTGEQGIFVPQPYEQQQTDWIETFFKDNGFIGKNKRKEKKKKKHQIIFNFDVHLLKSPPPWVLISLPIPLLII
jgi:hypothetical protein